MRNLTRIIGILLVLFVGICIANISYDIPVEELKKSYANEHSQFVTVEGTDVHFRDEGTGFPIVLLHGTGASLHTWDAWAEGLQSSYRVIRMDLPAFGLTGPTAGHDYSLEGYAQFLQTFLNTLAIDSCYLAGNSLGGAIAWYYTAQYPEKVQKLVLIDPAGVDTGQDIPFVFKLARTPILNTALTYITPRSFIAKNLKEVYYDDTKITEELIDLYHRMALREGNRIAFIERAKLDFKDYSSLLTQIEVPTLLLWGKEDVWIPAHTSLRYQELLPHSERVLMEQTGHIPMEENPNQSLYHTLQFLTSPNQGE